jgi:hypothetical protein
MRVQNPLLQLSAALLLVMTMASVTQGALTDPVSIWHFNNTLDSATDPSRTLSANNFAPSYITDTVDGSNRTVLNLPALTSAQSLGLPAHFGNASQRVNEWTLTMDVKAPSLAPFLSLLQNNPNNNSDVDFFVRTDGQIDTGFTPPIAPPGSVTANAYHRITIRRETGANGLVAFVDGIKGSPGNGYGNNDGDFSMPKTPLLFSDNSGDTTPMLISSVAFWGEALSDAEVASLGGVTNSGIQVGPLTPPTPVSTWEFDGNLANEVNPVEPLTANGFAPVFTGTTINGEAATVLDLPALTSAQTLAAMNSVGANGGGTETNIWSLAMDIKADSLSPFVSLLQTDPTNSQDVDIFLRGNGVIDLESSNAGGPVPAGEFVRLVLTQEVNGGGLLTKAYLGGAFLGQANNTLDGDTGLQSIFHLFSDNSGDTTPMQINSVAYWAQTLTANQVLALGGPDADGIFNAAAPTGAVPEPATGLLVLLAGATLIRRRRSI